MADLERRPGVHDLSDRDIRRMKRTLPVRPIRVVHTVPHPEDVPLPGELDSFNSQKERSISGKHIIYESKDPSAFEQGLGVETPISRANRIFDQLNGDRPRIS